MMSKAELRAKLQEAEKAYYEIISGRGIRVLHDQNGEKIEYGPANITRLSSYIAELKRVLGCASVSGPMRVFF